MYVVAEPEAIERVLVHDNELYSKGELFQSNLRPSIGRGLIASEGERWRRERRRIEPAFHPDRIERYGSVAVERTEAAIEAWRDGAVVDLHETMMELTLEIVAEALFGVDVGDRAGAIADAIEAITAYAEATRTDYVPLSVPIPVNRRMRAARALLDDVADEVVAEAREEATDTVVSMLLERAEEDGEPISRDLLRDEVVTLLLAGHETTALALTYTFHALARHADVEARLVTELDAVLDGDPPAVADLDALSYTNHVLTESLRLCPPVWAMLREPECDVDLAGYPIPAGSTLWLPQIAVHRDPRLYDDPMAFRPARWADDLESELPRFGYFPFGGGPRRCIGDRLARLEARLVLATIARHYHLELVSDPSLAVEPGITMRPSDPIDVRVHER